MLHLLVDSDVLIEVSRGNQQVAKLLNEQQVHYRLCVSVISRYELMVGALNKQDLNKIIDFLQYFYCYSLNDEIARKAEQLLKQYTLSHRLKIADGLIASTALCYDLPLLSRNKKDFCHIDGLRLIPYPNG